MIQFNLLPDVKLAYIKAQRTKRLVISVSILASIAAGAVLLLLLFTVDVVQKKNLSDLNKDIKTNTTALENTPNLNKILTIQNQLAALTSLHDQKPAASRLFSYLSQVTPTNITISNTEVDFTQNTVTVSGNGPSLDAVNTFADTLKFTTYTTDKSTDSAKAFSDVVLSGFSRSASTTSYTLTFNFDPLIFNVTNNVTLVVPSTVTTRSVTEQPSALFNTTTTEKK